MSDININDVVSFPALNRVLKSFHSLTGFAISVVDRNQKKILDISATDFFEQTVCKSDSGANRLQYAFKEMVSQSASKNAPVTLPGICGVYKTAIPVVIDSQFTGAIIAGPVMFSKNVTEDEIRKASEDILIDCNELKDSIHKIKVIPKPVYDSYISMIFNVVKAFGEQYTANSEIIAENERLKEGEGKFTEIEEVIRKNSEATGSLIHQFDVLDKLTEEATKQLESTSDTVKVIQNIAMNTRILGFNASIEASRAKESGKGFGVIAQEVRSLADVSKSSAEKIEEYINTITKIANEIRSTVLDTREIGKITSINRGNIQSIISNEKKC